MANRRPLSELSPAYRQRIQRAIEKGLIEPDGSRQRARGKTAQEYAQRVERRRNPPTTPIGGLTPSQKGQVTRFARQMANFDPPLDEEETADLIAAGQEWATLQGYDRFASMRDRQRRLMTQYQQERADGSYVQRPGLLQIFTEAFNIADVRWFFYH